VGNSLTTIFVGNNLAVVLLRRLQRIDHTYMHSCQPHFLEMTLECANMAKQELEREKNE
jgi:hypothetical protein